MSRGLKKEKMAVWIEGPAALIGCLLGLNQLPAGCRVDNSGITHCSRQAEPLGAQEEEGPRPISSVQERRALRAHVCGQFAAEWCLSEQDTAGTTRCLLLLFFTVCFFFGSHLHLRRNLFHGLLNSSRSEARDAGASPRAPLYPETCLASVPAGSVERDPARNKTRWRGGLGGRRHATGYKLLHKRDLCSAAGSQCATEAFHFVVIANCNSPRHMISPDDNRGSRRGSRNLLFALK